MKGGFASGLTIGDWIYVCVVGGEELSGGKMEGRFVGLEKLVRSKRHEEESDSSGWREVGPKILGLGLMFDGGEKWGADSSEKWGPDESELLGNKIKSLAGKKIGVGLSTWESASFGGVRRDLFCVRNNLSYKKQHVVTSKFFWK